MVDGARAALNNKEGSCLRVETVINNPYEFKVRRKKEDGTKWCPMNKGISNLYAYAAKALAANQRYLDALSGVGTQNALDKIDDICEKKRQTESPFQPSIQ